MAYRRKPQPQPQPTPSFEHHYPPFVGPASPDSLAAQAMRASAAHRDASSLASAYSSSASLAASLRSHHDPSVSTPSPVCLAVPLSLAYSLSAVSPLDASGSDLARSATTATKGILVILGW